MKILILNNLFNTPTKGDFVFIKKLLKFYQKRRLINLINCIEKKSSEDTEICLINYFEEHIDTKKNFNVQFLSDFRTELNRREYQDIVKKVKSNTKNINKLFQENINKLKIFSFNKIPFNDLLEIHLIRFFNKYSGDLKLINYHISTRNYDKIILFDCNPYFLNFFRAGVKKKKIEYYNNRIYDFSQKLLKKFELIRFQITKIGNALIKRSSKLMIDKKKNNILIIANSRNQYSAIKPIYIKLKRNPNINPIIYSQKFYLRLDKLTQFFQYINHNKKIWNNHFSKICKGMGLYSNLMRAFYKDELFFLLSIIFNEYFNLTNIFRKIRPKLVTISNESRVESKLASKLSSLKSIPNIYIPHASVPLVGELICKKDYYFSALWGEKDKEFYINLGMPNNKLIVTGNPKFESLYQHGVKKIEKVYDMFDKQVYEFNDNEVNILLATSPFDEASKKKLIIHVVDALKELKLIDNLIIKLHPSESGLFHKNVVKNLEDNPIIIRDYNVLELIKSSDILISCMSSIILEAMIVGVPVILAEFVNLGFTFIQPYAFTNKQFLRVAVTPQSLIEHIKELTHDKGKFNEYSNNLRESSKLFSFYDKANPTTEKIMNLILKIINKNSLE